MKIMYLIFISFLFCLAPNTQKQDPIVEQYLADVLRFQRMPFYIRRLTDKYGLDRAVVYRWSWAESRHKPNAISKSHAYGRFQVTHEALDDYCRYNNRKFPKDWKKWLLNDWENATIALWYFNLYKQIGFSDREFVQCWLWGAKNVYEKGRWSEKYEKEIFYTNTFPILNRRAYEDFISGCWNNTNI